VPWHSPGSKAVDQSPPTSGEVKMLGALPPLPHMTQKHWA